MLRLFRMRKGSNNMSPSPESSHNRTPRRGYLFSCYTLDTCGGSRPEAAVIGHTPKFDRDAYKTKKSIVMDPPPVSDTSLLSDSIKDNYGPESIEFTVKAAVERGRAEDTINITRAAYYQSDGTAHRAMQLASGDVGSVGVATVACLFLAWVLLSSLVARGRFRILRPRAAGAGALVPLFRAQSLSTTSVSAAGSGPSQEEIFRYWQWCVQVRLLQASAGLPPLPYGIPLVVCSAGPGELRVFARVATVSRGSSGRSQRAAAPTSIDGRVAAKHTRAFILFEALGYDVTISGSEISQFALALSSSFSRTASDPAALVNPDTAASSDEPREVIGVARDRVVDAGWGSAGMDVSALAEEDDDHLFCMTPLQNFYGIGAGGETLSTGLGVGIGEDAVDECLGLDSPSKASRVKALSTTFTTSKSQWSFSGQARNKRASHSRGDKRASRSRFLELPVQSPIQDKVAPIFSKPTSNPISIFKTDTPPSERGPPIQVSVFSEVEGGRGKACSSMWTLPTEAPSDSAKIHSTTSSSGASKWALPVQTATTSQSRANEEKAKSASWTLPGQVEVSASSRGRERTRRPTWAIGKAHRGSPSPDAGGDTRFSFEAGGGTTDDESEADATQEKPPLRAAARGVDSSSRPRSILKTVDGGGAKQSRASLRVSWRETLVEEDPAATRQRAQRAARWLRPHRTGPPTTAPRKSRAREYA